MSKLLSDLRYAARIHRRTPAQTLTAIIMIAVASAFAAAFFRIYNNVALQPPAGVEAPGELVGIGLSDGDAFDPRLPGRLQSAIAARAATIDAVAGVVYVDDRLSVAGALVRARTGVVSSDYFDGLGVEMHIGRGLPSDPSGAAEHVAVLDYRFWERHFDSNPAALGQRLEIGGATFTIIGVADTDFRGMHRGTNADVWFPLEAFAASVWNASVDVIRDNFRTYAVGRLASGHTIGDAGSELGALSETLRGEFRDDLLGLQLIPFEHLAYDPMRYADAALQVRWLVGASVLLAVVAASNLGLFLLARGARRRRELAIRVSLGATTSRLARQLLTESSVLVVTGIALGLLAQAWLVELIRGLPLLDGIAWLSSPAVDGRLVAFCAALALVVLAVVGAVPAANLSRRSIAQRARSTGSGLPGSQRIVVAAQIGIAAVVLSIAALFGLNQLRAALDDPGYDKENVKVVMLRPTGDERPPDAASVLTRRQALQQRLLAIPGVDAVGFGNVAPGVLSPDTYLVEAVAAAPVEIASQVARVNPGWYHALQARWLAGGAPAPEDDDAVVVSRRFAERAWGRLDVVGETLRAPARHSRAGGAVEGLSPLRVAGVVDDITFADASGSTAPAVFVNATLPYDFGAFIVVRGPAKARDVELAVSDELARGAPAIEVTGVTAVAEAVDRLTAPDRVRTAMSGIAAAFVALMAALGLFGALRLVLESARFELALRAAIGADTNALRSHAIGRGVVLGLPGLLLGLLVSALVLGVVRREFELWQVGIVPALAVCALLLGLLMSVFVWRVAARATRIEPSSVLRSE
ncbi:MAG: ABC transporter permease [Gammaproteobacteria bacterium]|nr:ABC transporter permease [Gammaproteobacteria bacterium]